VKKFKSYENINNRNDKLPSLIIKKMDKDRYCVLLAEVLTEEMNTKITSDKVSEQLMLIELGQEPTDKLIGTWIKKTSNFLHGIN